MKRYLITTMALWLIIFAGAAASDTWKLAYNNADFNLGCISCADSLNCMAIGYKYQLFSSLVGTTDGGSSWTLLRDGSLDGNKDKPPFRNLLYQEKGLCLVLCEKGTLLRTTDRGANWITQQLPDEVILSSVDFLDGTTGIISSDHHIYKTQNGGKDWGKINIPPFLKAGQDTARILAIAMLSENTLLIKAAIQKTPAKTAIFRTEDGGKNWTQYQFPDNCTWGFRFIDSLNGWSTGGDPIPGDITGKATHKIIHTSDGGKTWAEQINSSQPEPDYGLNDIDFTDRSTGLAAGPYGALMSTTNGGKNWDRVKDNPLPQDYPETVNLSRAGYCGFFISAYNGKIYKYVTVTDMDENPKIEYSHVLCYPNPAGGEIGLNIRAGKEGLYTITVYNVAGERMNSLSINLTKAEEKTIKLDTGNYGQGIYQVVMRSAGGVVTRMAAVVK